MNWRLACLAWTLLNIWTWPFVIRMIDDSFMAVLTYMTAVVLYIAGFFTCMYKDLTQ